MTASGSSSRAAISTGPSGPAAGGPGTSDRPPTRPKQRLLATSAGHQILIDEEANEIKLVHPGGAEISLGASAITLRIGSCEITISESEVNINHGMVKVTTAGASLVNDAFKVGV